MRSVTRYLATLTIAAVGLATFVSPASAHKREFDWVYGAAVSDDELHGQAALTTGRHPGKMRMTLKKKVDGEWRAVRSKIADYKADGRYYEASFAALKGDKKCKVFAKHTAQDHPTIKASSNWFVC